MPSKDEILKALSTVEDPDLKRDLVSLKMIKDLEVEDRRVSFTVELTTPACPLKEKIRKDCEDAVLKVSNDIDLNIKMSANVTSFETNKPAIEGIKNIIAIASGKGGVGKSTISSNLAVALAKDGAKVGLIDADIFGPSVPTMFNCENEHPEIKIIDGNNRIMPIEQYGVKLLSIGFLTPAEKAVVWRGPMASSALKQFFSDTEWGELDYLLIDLPPGTSDIHLTLVQTVPVTGAVIVTTPQKVALDDAQKGVAMFQQDQINVPILGIVENMAWFTPEELPENKYFIFGKHGGKNFAEKHGMNLLAQVPIVQGIRESGDSGHPAVLKEGLLQEVFLGLARNTARRIAIRNASMEKTKTVKMQ